MADISKQEEHELAAVKAATLIESLPWLKRFSGKIVVVKFGGNAMVNDDLKRAFAEDMVYLRYAGIHPVVVHGGGPQISAALKEQGIESEFRGGYRVTTTEAITVVRDVLAGEVNREIVDLVNEHGEGLAVGVFGDGGSLFTGEQKGVVVDGQAYDLGHVGDITHVDPSGVLAAIEAGRIPVVSSIAIDDAHPDQALNVNADAAAGALAIALKASKLLMLTDVPGLYRNWPDRDSLVDLIAVDELRELLPSLESGMIPKMTACLDAVVGGVGGATIIDGRIPHSILLEVFTLRGAGTEVIPDPRRRTENQMTHAEIGRRVAAPTSTAGKHEASTTEASTTEASTTDGGTIVAGTTEKGHAQ